ncbi:MAG: hypothetical protein ACRETQ_01545 [Gammaproteobacteria bacterium]
MALLVIGLATASRQALAAAQTSQFDVTFFNIYVLPVLVSLPLAKSLTSAAGALPRAVLERT